MGILRGGQLTTDIYKAEVRIGDWLMRTIYHLEEHR